MLRPLNGARPHELHQRCIRHLFLERVDLKWCAALVHVLRRKTKIANSANFRNSAAHYGRHHTLSQRAGVDAE